MDRPKSIFEFHSNSVAIPAGNNYLTDCPLCGKEKHFFFHPESEMWDCKVCGKRGNPIEFLRQFYDGLETATRAATELAAARQLPFSAMNNMSSSILIRSCSDSSSSKSRNLSPKND